MNIYKVLTFENAYQYNIIRTELRKVSSQLTTTVNIAKHHFLEVADSIDSMRENVEAIHEGR